MGLLGFIDKFKKPQIADFETAEFSEDDCAGCEFAYPATFSASSDKLWESCGPNSCQILIATGETDWSREPKDDNGSYAGVCKALSGASDQLEKAVGGNVRVNASSEENNGDKITVTVLPQFLSVETTAQDCVQDVLEILAIKSNSQAVPAKFTKIRARGYLLLCSHKTRDKNCGITAPILRKSLETELRDEGLYRDYGDDTPGGVPIVFVNHVGGHKWAANCFYYGSDGSAILMAKVRPEHAKPIVQKTILQGIVFPEILRNCSKNHGLEWPRWEKKFVMSEDVPMADAALNDKITVLPGASADGSAASFQIKYEDHTLGNALKYLVMRNPEVEFCGYSIPHPSETLMNIRIQTYGDITAIEALRKGLKDLVEVCDVVDAKFRERAKATSEYTQDKSLD